MTTIEFQTMLNTFFKIDNGTIKVKDLVIEDDIIQINANDKQKSLAGFQILRGDEAPLNIIWSEDTQTLNFTLGSDLAKINCYLPGPSVVKLVKDTFLNENENIVIVEMKDKNLFLPKTYKDYLRIKLKHPPLTVIDIKGNVVDKLTEAGTYTYVQHENEWIML